MRWPVRVATVLVAVMACTGVRRPARPEPPLPHAAYASYLDGKLAGYRNDWPAAVEALTIAARAAPDQPMIVVELARALVKAKRRDAAREALATARRRWPEHPEVWLASGDLLATDSQKDAMNAYRRGIELAPDDERGYVGLAKLETDREAEAVLRQLVERVPDSVDGHYRLAQLLGKRGDHAAAKRELVAVIERDPDHIDARIDLARTLRRTGDLAQAIAQTRSAFDRSGQALDIAEELYWLLLEADDRTGAIDLLTLLDDDRSDLDALAQIARLYKGLGHQAQARAVANRIALADAEAGAVLTAELELATDPTAVSRLLQIAPDAKRFREARRLAGEALLTADDPKGALEAVAPARERAPKDADLALIAARARADLGDRAGARAVLDALDRGLAASFARARLAEHVGDIDGALAILEPLVRENPDSAAVHNLAGYLLADANRRLPDAETWLRVARDLQPGDPAILDSWGWLQFRKGDRRAAIKTLEHATRIAPNEPEILLHLATVQAADGAKRAAVTTLDRALALRPPSKLRRRLEALRGTMAP